MDDKQLRKAIMDELEFDPRIDAANVAVVVDDGIVTLTGHVASYVEKVAAENAARRVKGVRAIAEELTVRYPSDKKTADDEIAKRAVKILRVVRPHSPARHSGYRSTWMDHAKRRGQMAVPAQVGRACRTSTVRHRRRAQSNRDQACSISLRC